MMSRIQLFIILTALGLTIPAGCAKADHKTAKDNVAVVGKIIIGIYIFQQMAVFDIPDTGGTP